MSTHSRLGQERGNEFLSLLNSSFGRNRGGLNVQRSFVRRTTLTSERSLLPRFLALTAVGPLLIALSASARSAPVQTAVIENTGSTNTTGYRVTVSSDGSASMVMDSPRIVSQSEQATAVVQYKHRTVKAATKLFQDLKDAMPLTSLPVRHGMRSASFGTATYITYKGQKSPDLTFASDPRIVALKADIDQITKALHVGNAPRRPNVIHSDR